MPAGDDAKEGEHQDTDATENGFLESIEIAAFTHMMMWSENAAFVQRMIEATMASGDEPPSR